MHPKLAQKIDDLYNEMIIDLQKVPEKEEEHFWAEANAKRLAIQYEISEEQVVSFITMHGELIRMNEEEERTMVTCPGCTEAQRRHNPTYANYPVKHLPPVCRTAEEYERDRPTLEKDFAEKLHALCDSGALDATN